MIFKHLSGKIVEVGENTPASAVYTDSPSWRLIEFKESDTKEGLYSMLTRDDLRELCRLRNIDGSKYNTKDELIELLESKDIKVETTAIHFSDNLVVEN